MKLLMYSHDTFGLGHIRRTLLIAEYLTNAYPELSTLILTGSSMIHDMRIHPNVDYIKVPCLTKHSNSCYQPKYLTRSPDQVKRLRREIISNTIREYNPDLLLVDKVPAGALGELLPSLRCLRADRRQTRVVLGLRDILDEREQVRAEWAREGIYEVLESCYDDIWVYGTREIFDVVEEYGLPRSIAEKVHYCGFLKRGGDCLDPAVVRRRLNLSGERLVMMVLGGGGDGHEIVKVFLGAMDELSRSGEFMGLVLTGPDYPDHELGLLLREERRGTTTIKDYTVDVLDIMNAADLVVSMSGYNTICEILSLNKKAIVIPRVTPRKEQLIRATLLSEKGLVRMIHPSDLTTDVLRRGILEALSNGSHRVHPFDVIDFNGLESIGERFDAIRREAVSRVPVSSEIPKLVARPDTRRGAQ